MNTYFMTFEVTPAKANEHFNLVGGALVSCWVLDNDPQSAFFRAKFMVSKDNWEIEKVETYPVTVTRECFRDRDDGMEQYTKAQEDGISIFYTAWARDGKTTTQPFVVNSSYKLNLAEYLKKQKQLSQKGRCLHFDGDHRCKNIINAHSIQKSQSLEAIADNGQVYKPSASISALKRNKGGLSYEKCGINRVSTFLGFCKKHDNELFEPIDNYPLMPTSQQVFLYAYRSLCRELFVTENAASLFESQSLLLPDSVGIRELFKGISEGKRIGLESLREHKCIYDESLRNKTYFNIRYVLFISTQKPFIAFSGLLYPEFDFMGRHLQALGSHEHTLDLITMCTAPLSSGWGVLFSWHESSSNVCTDFMRSLATMVHEGHNLGDLIFRIAISNCENLAIAPEWWEGLSEEQKHQIESKASLMANIFSITKPTYLMEGLEGIAPWDFDSVIDNMN